MSQRRGGALVGVVVVAAVLAVVAVVVALLVVTGDDGGSEDAGGGASSDAGGSDAAEASTGPGEAERDEILAVAERALVAVSTRSYRSFDADLERSLPLLTPRLGGELKATAGSLSSQYASTRTEISVRVEGSGLGVVDDDRARVLSFFEQVVTRDGGAPETYRYDAGLTLLRQGDGSWLLDQLDTVGLVDPDDPDPGRQAALTAAEAVGEAFLTVDHRTYDDDVDALLALATDDYAQQLQEILDVAAPGVRDTEVERTARADGAGLAEYAGDTATALVALTSSTRSAAQPKSRTARVRMRIELELVDGGWFASNIAAVE